MAHEPHHTGKPWAGEAPELEELDQFPNPLPPIKESQLPPFSEVLAAAEANAHKPREQYTVLRTGTVGALYLALEVAMLLARRSDDTNSHVLDRVSYARKALNADLRELGALEVI